MPESLFVVELPDGTHHQCYSPSSVVKNYFMSGQTLSVSEFLKNATDALTEASDRVQKKFGFACTAASSSLDDIKNFCEPLDSEDSVTIISV